MIVDSLWDNGHALLGGSGGTFSSGDLTFSRR